MSQNDYTVVDGKQFHDMANKEDSTDKVLLRKQFTPKIEKSDHMDEERKVKFVISTQSPDRDNDTISTEGWDLEAYKNNPVVLFAHDNRTPPIAKASDIGVENGSLKATAEFMPKEMSEFADSIYQMIQGEFLKATSVGFAPLEFTIDEERGGLDFIRQQLLEYSVVPVPANPDALVEAKSQNLNIDPYKEWLEEALDNWLEFKDEFLVPRKDVEKLWFAAKGEDPDKATSRRRLKVINATGEEIMADEQESGEKTEDEEATSAVDSAENEEKESSEDQGSEETVTEKEDKMTISFSRAHSGGTPKAAKDREWDGPEEMAKANVEDLWAMATWVAELSEDEEEHDKEDFKLPHHIAENRHPVVWRGVVAAMASLMGARGGVDVPETDRRGIYNHLAKHYREFDEEPPAFEAAQEQILAKEGWTMDYEKGHPVTIENGEVKYYEVPKSDEYVELENKVKALEEEVAALKETFGNNTDNSQEYEESTDEEGEGKSDNLDQEEITEAELKEALADVFREEDIDEEVSKRIETVITSNS